MATEVNIYPTEARYCKCDRCDALRVTFPTPFSLRGTGSMPIRLCRECMQRLDETITVFMNEEKKLGA